MSWDGIWILRRPQNRWDTPGHQTKNKNENSKLWGRRRPGGGLLLDIPRRVQHEKTYVHICATLLTTSRRKQTLPCPHSENVTDTFWTCQWTHFYIFLSKQNCKKNRYKTNWFFLVASGGPGDRKKRPRPATRVHG